MKANLERYRWNPPEAVRSTLSFSIWIIYCIFFFKIEFLQPSSLVLFYIHKFYSKYINFHSIDLTNSGILIVDWSSSNKSPISQWPFDGIKTCPKIFLFSSKIKNCWIPILIFVLKTCLEKFQKYFVFFVGILTSKQIVPTKDFRGLKVFSANLLIFFSVKDFHRRIRENFYIIFLHNVSTNNLCIALGKTQNAEIQIHKIDQYL